MTPEERAAVERLRRYKRSGDGVYCTDEADAYSADHSNTLLEHDEEVLAELYLREHPADEEEPYSQNFCESVGFVFQNDSVYLATLTVNGIHLMLRRDYVIHMGTYAMPQIKTCGQLRRLLAAVKGSSSDGQAVAAAVFGEGE